MSLYNYKNAPIIKRVETIVVKSADFPTITNNTERTRVKKILDIRREVRSAYLINYKEADVHFVNGVISDVLKTKDQHTVPDELVFEVTLHMPLVSLSNAVGGYKGADGLKTFDYKQSMRDNIPPTWRADNDHIYWS